MVGLLFMTGAGYIAAPLPLAPCLMLSLLFAFLFKAFLPAILLVALVDWLTMSRDRKARTLRRQGLTYRQIGARLGFSASTARRLCLA